MKNFEKYQVGYFPPPQPHNSWVTKDHVEKAPIWCSVDLRDGNQALIVPMNLQEKVDFFQYLVKLGFKEIEVGFPAASETEYQFLRKLLEKNCWSASLGLSMLTAYETQRILSETDRKQLYYRFSYPEKFWKIVNFYYNNGKAWIPDKNREKLETLLCQENEKVRFLDSVLR